jgi:hypothetical protein
MAIYMVHCGCADVSVIWCQPGEQVAACCAGLYLGAAIKRLGTNQVLEQGYVRFGSCAVVV